MKKGGKHRAMWEKRNVELQERTQRIELTALGERRPLQPRGIKKYIYVISNSSTPKYKGCLFIIRLTDRTTDVGGKR